MGSIHRGFDICKPHRAPSPGEVLEERLKLGMSAPDAELVHRAENCGRWLRSKPWMRGRWMPRLREAADSPLTAHLWPAVASILLRAGTA